MRTESSRVLAIFAAVLLLAAASVDVAFFEGQKNGKVQGFEKIDPAMFRAGPRKSKFYTEVWFHEMQFADQGLIVIVNIQMHNMGLGSGYCEAGISVSDPEGNYFYEYDSLTSKDVKIDPVGFGLTMGPHRVELVGDKYYVKYQGAKIKAELVYRIKTGSFQQGNATVTFKQSGDWVMHNFPIPWAEISGAVTYNGKTLQLKGQGSMNHDRQVLSPTRYMSDWRAVWAYTPEATVSIVRASAPDLQGKWSQRLMVAEPGKILYSSNNYSFQNLDYKPVPGFKVPCAMRYRVESIEGQDWLKGEIRVTRIQEKRNVLSDYPAWFRALAKVVVSDTLSYRFWCDFDFEFKLDGKTRAIRGTGTGNFVSSVKNAPNP